MKFIFKIKSRIIFHLAVAVFLFGCASPNIVKMDLSLPERIAEISILDSRPSEELIFHEGRNILTCDYGVRRYGDGDTMPSRVNILKADLYHSFGEEIFSKTIELKHYLIYLNTQLGLKKLTADISSSGQNQRKQKLTCSPTKLNGGYDIQGVMTEGNPIVIFIELTIEGRHYESHLVYTAESEDIAAKASDSIVFPKAIKLAHTQLIEKIVSDM